MDDYLNDDLGPANPDCHITFKECTLENTAPQVYTVWADHQTRDLLSNRQADNNSLIKPYLNGGVYEKSDIQIQNIMQRHRMSTHMNRPKMHRPRTKNRSYAIMNQTKNVGDIIYVPQHELDFLEMSDHIKYINNEDLSQFKKPVQ